MTKRCESCWRSTPWTAHNSISWTDLESVKSPHSNKQQTENTLKSEESTTSHINIAKRCEGCWRSTPWTAHNRISWTDLESVKSPHSVRPRKEESKIKVQTRCKVLLPAGQAAGYEG